MIGKVGLFSVILGMATGVVMGIPVAAFVFAAAVVVVLAALGMELRERRDCKRSGQCITQDMERGENGELRERFPVIRRGF